MLITVSGMLGSGKSTICKVLKDEYGFEFFSTGKIMRDQAAKLGLTIEEFNKKLSADLNFAGLDIDKVIDQGTVEFARANAGKKIVFDSRMAWFFVPESFKVFVTVDPAVAAQRVVSGRILEEENYKSKEECYAALESRKKLEDERYLSLYGANTRDMKNYDLVLDSTSKTPQELVKEILLKTDKR